MIPLVDLKAQYRSIKTEIDEAVHRILDNTSFIMGKEVAEFEAAFAEYAGAKHAIGVASGTDALLLAMVAWGIGEGDEIITVSHTFIATIEPIIQLGAVPVFVDIDPVTYNMNPAEIEAKITERTKAIVPVHLYGQPANMAEISAIAKKHNLHIIEDAAQAHGAEFEGKRPGHWGEFAGFSFYPGKNLGAAGDAGGIITDHDDMADELRMLLNHGSASKYEHVRVGYNARLDAMQAAVLRVKLNYIEDWTENRRANARYYDEILKDMPGIIIPKVDERARHVYHLYVIQVPGDRDTFLKYLHENGVGAGIHYPLPVHLQPAMESLGYKAGDLPVTESVARQIISLPMFPELTRAQMDQVAETIQAYLSTAEIEA